MQAEALSLSLSHTHTHTHMHPCTVACWAWLRGSWSQRAEGCQETWRSMCVFLTQKSPLIVWDSLMQQLFNCNPSCQEKKREIHVTGREVYSHRLQNNCVINTGKNSFFMVKKWGRFWMLSRHEGGHISGHLVMVMWKLFAPCVGIFPPLYARFQRQKIDTTVSYQRRWGWIPVLRGSGPGCS